MSIQVKEQNKDISKIQELGNFTSHKEIIENIHSTKKKINKRGIKQW